MTNGDIKSPSTKVRRLVRIQIILCRVFLMSLVSLFGGFGLGLLGLDIGVYLYELAWCSVFLLLFTCLVILRFVRCPMCGRRFFMPHGFWGIFAGMDVLRRGCMHCGAKGTEV